MSSQALLRVKAADHQSQQTPSTSVAVHWRLLVLLAGSAAFLAANLYSWRLHPFLLGGDQVYFWTAAWRMLQGERLYQDFLQFTPPGMDLVYLGLFRLFGPRIWVTNALALALGVALSGLCYALARRVMDRPQALLAGSLFTVALYGKLLCVTHHWLSTLAVLTATLILMRALNTGRLIAAGALLGLASFFTQTRGAAALVAVMAYLIWESGIWEGRQQRWSVAMLARKAGLLAASFCASLAALNAYFIRSAGLTLLWNLQVSYVARYVTRAYKTGPFDLGLPHLLTLNNLPALAQHLAVYILAPLVCGMVLLQQALLARQPSRNQTLRQPSGADASTRDPVLLLAAVAGALLTEVATDITWLRLYCVAMPCVVLLVWLTQARGSGVRLTGQPAAVAGRLRQITQRSWVVLQNPAPLVLWAVVVLLGVQQVWGRQSTQDQLLQLPGGSVVLSADAAERYGWIARHTRPGQAFLQATWPGPYLPLGLRAPVYLDVFSGNRPTRPEWVERSVRQLEEQPVRYIMVGSAVLNPRDRRPGEYPLSPFISLLDRHYRLIRTFSNSDQVWERRSEP